MWWWWWEGGGGVGVGDCKLICESIAKVSNWYACHLTESSLFDQYCELSTIS